MQSAEYLRQSGFENNISLVESEHDHVLLFNLTEFVLLNSLKQDVSVLEEIIKDDPTKSDASVEDREQFLVYAESGIPEGGTIDQFVRNPDPSGADRLRQQIDDAKASVSNVQAQALAYFAYRHLAENRGENAKSMNKRLLKTVVLPELQPFAASLTRSGTESQEYSFHLNGTSIEADRGEHYKYGALKSLHSALLEFDALVSLYYLTDEMNLPYIPIVGSPSVERFSAKGEGGNFNADLLLIREDLREVIPFQIKVDAQYDSHKYAEPVVMVDARTLQAASHNVGVVTGKRDNKSTSIIHHVTAGEITQKALRASRRRQPPKSLGKITGRHEVTKRVFEQIRQNPHHQVEFAA